MDTYKAKLESPGNQAWFKKALAVFTARLRDKLESGEHGHVGISVEVREGGIQNLREDSPRWWRSTESLNRY